MDKQATEDFSWSSFWLGLMTGLFIAFVFILSQMPGLP
jgi:hypothetical protein